jgi:hypothetical protein
MFSQLLFRPTIGSDFKWQVTAVLTPAVTERQPQSPWRDISAARHCFLRYIWSKDDIEIKETTNYIDNDNIIRAIVD